MGRDSVKCHEFEVNAAYADEVKYTDLSKLVRLFSGQNTSAAMNIMISYRRADSGPITGRIYDRLQAHFGADHVFIDIDSIPMGIDYRHHIDTTIKRCDILLPVIGPLWTGPGEVGKRRIDDPSDLVRLEVAHALELNIRVIPLLVEDAQMPATDELPSDLKGLRLRNSLQVDSGVDFHHHMNRLCVAIERATTEIAGQAIAENHPTPSPAASLDVSSATPAQKASDHPVASSALTAITKVQESVGRRIKSALACAQPVFTRFRKSKWCFPVIGGVALLIVAIAMLHFIPRKPLQTTAKEQLARNVTIPTNKISTSHVPLADGAMVQREELSPSGNLRVRYVRSKGNPVRQIVLESVNQPGESKAFFDYQRNAWILISPDDQWIALNNRPSAGHCEVQLYQHEGPGPLDYAVPGELQGPDAQLDEVVWKYYLQELGLPPETPREGIALDAVGWDSDSKKLAVTVVVAQADGEDKVPPPWSCVVDVATKEIDVTPEATQAFNSQQAQVSASPSGNAVLGQLIAQTSSNKMLEGDFPGERYQETRTRTLMADEISRWSASHVRYAIEEIYARRGADFSDQPDVQKRFSKFAWYKPRPSVSVQQIDAELSDVERQNVQTLEKARDAREAAAPKSRAVRRAPEPGEKVKQLFKRIFSH